MLKKENYLARLWPLYLVIFVGFVGYSLMITIFTPLLLNSQTNFLGNHITHQQQLLILGILLSTYPLGQFIGCPVIGSLSDRYGRKLVLISTLLLCIIFYICIALSIQHKSLVSLIISTLLAGLCEGNIAVAQSAINDLSDDISRPRLFGYIYMSASLAYVIGPLFGGHLAENYNSALPFYMVAIFIIIILFMTITTFKETLSINERSKHSIYKSVTSFMEVFKPTLWRRNFLSNFLIYTAVFGFLRAYPMYLVAEFNMGIKELSLFIGFVGIPIIICNAFIIGLLSRKYTPQQLTRIAVAMMIVFLLGVISPIAKHWLWLTLACTSFSIAILLTSTSSGLALVVNESQKTMNKPSTAMGKVMGNNQSLQVAAEALTGFFAGWLATYFIQLPLLCCCVIGAIAVLITKPVKKKYV